MDAPTPTRVLIVEDLEYEAEFASRQLTAAGIAHLMQRVETEETMRVALRDFDPTIILSDFSLPRFDGLSALKIAQECAPEVPFLFVSGTIGEERAIEALHLGAVDYVLKTNLARLAPAVRRALEEAAARTVRHQQERQIARLNAVLRMLSGINSAVVRIRERKELLREACRLAVTVGGYPTAIVALRKPKKQALEPIAWSGADEESARRLIVVVSQMAAGKKAPQTRHSNTVVRFVYSERQASAAAGREPAQGRAVIGLPLLIDKTSIGMLVIAAQEPDRLRDEELRVLREVAANLSFALQYLRKYTKVRYFDILTGLANRRLFCDRMVRFLQGREPGSQCTIAVLDIENLSAINDSFGRHSGDLLLQLVADRLKRRFPDTELLAHFAGGTFAVAQSQTDAPAANLPNLHAEIDRLFCLPFRLEGKEVPVAARSGAARYPDDGAAPEALVQRAEATLRTAKLGHERHRQYSAAAHSASLARVARERKLRLALEGRQFELHYQPKVDVKSRRIAGVEALIRWNDPREGLISPKEFLPILESSGLINEVGQWVIEQAGLDCRHWRDLGVPAVRVAVNISPVQLRATDFVPHFLKSIQGWSDTNCGLDVEITEGALVDEFSGEVAKLKMLRTAGISVAIDDFGTGYSSLSRLASLPIDTLKIDRSFVSQMTTDARASKLVSSMISIARAFKMLVVAEGVEREEQLDALRQLDCDHSQGYLHCKPVCRDEISELLEHGRGRYILAQEAMRATDADLKSAG